MRKLVPIVIFALLSYNLTGQINISKDTVRLNYLKGLNNLRINISDTLVFSDGTYMFSANMLSGITADSLMSTAWDSLMAAIWYIGDSSLITAKAGDTIATSEWVRSQNYGGITADSLQNTAWEFNESIYFINGISIEGEGVSVDGDISGDFIRLRGINFTDDFNDTLLYQMPGDTIATSEWVRAQGYGTGTGGDYLPANYDSGTDIYTVTVVNDFTNGYHHRARIDTLSVGALYETPFNGYLMPYTRGDSGQVLKMGQDSLVFWGDEIGGNDTIVTTYIESSFVNTDTMKIGAFYYLGDSDSTWIEKPIGTFIRRIDE